MKNSNVKTAQFDDINPIGQAAPAENKRVPDVSAEIDGLRLVMKFKNGASLEIDANTLSKDIQQMAMMHGLKQKLGDAAAISRNPATGKSATIEDKVAAVQEVAERLIKEGQWNKVREGGGSNSGGMLLRALCELYPQRSPDWLKDFLAGKSDKERAALRATPQIAALIATYRKPSDEVDVDELLKGL